MDVKTRKKEILKEYKERAITGGAYVITNKVTGKMLLMCETDLKGSQNRFNFMSMTGSCFNSKLQKDWNEFGARSFTFTILEELEMKETQNIVEFKEDLKILEELWREKLGEDKLY
ncbi:hypothetical protein EDD70_0977 [Hydrogenoanaerobacterium saccharovorans]|uniref:GIY-YIG nuclease family protein n=1 Tax=Hydrogenoanaerobacterium saccharovorans TaxID=474960 RepID=A0A1H8A575_9FIRM|nr:GIY-YIG nuclease family protein [Hydrogenoanaerobacterium saccharovorans]RPF48164.1 hypothetical protein EDD70_0977 [Hydrogenoanaerobacterium saccharovorans]SEM65656.1 hypothetical protein SAMN05216180_1114 [Hydrogenoanaerobacterium saccharovorans]